MAYVPFTKWEIKGTTTALYFVTQDIHLRLTNRRFKFLLWL